MNQLAKLAVPLLSIGVAVSGCSQTEEPVADATSIEEPLAVSIATVGEPAAPLSANVPEVSASKIAGAVAEDFVPPFPQRLELFEPPQRALNAARRSEEHGETVELKGFINVNEPRVVLSIDGVVSTVPEGAEKYGVQVISIEPPTVVLQRGRNRWPATLE